MHAEKIGPVANCATGARGALANWLGLLEQAARTMAALAATAIKDMFMTLPLLWPVLLADWPALIG